jgi:tripartite-type tricarboxylate transporter receptor subunit TctC
MEEPPNAVGQIQGAGRVSFPLPMTALPDVPSLGDFLTGYDASLMLGIGAPKNTPPGVVETLNKEINAALSDPVVKERIANFGYLAFASSPAEYGKLIAEDIEKWAKVIKFAGIKPD